MSSVRLEGIEKRFKGTSVLQGLSVEIADGEFFTFVGPSGCGKSTILGIIAGLEPATGGRVFFDDEPVDRLSPRDRDVAVVFQSYALYPHMTVAENIAFPLRMRGTGRREAAAEAGKVAELLGLSGKLSRKPRELSGGERQRVALGRAIIRRPRVFLMDEPLSNLDPQLRVEMRAELKRLHREWGITTIYVTHDQSEALGLSDRMAVLSKGEIRQCAPPAEVYLHPSDLFVAGFVGSPPMNLFPAEMTAADPPAAICNGIGFRPEAGPVPAGIEPLLGIRPEDLELSLPPKSDAPVAVVTLIEPAGSFLWVGFDWQGIRGRGRAPLLPDLRAGNRVGLAFGRSLLFDRRSGRRL